MGPFTFIIYPLVYCFIKFVIDKWLPLERDSQSKDATGNLNITMVTKWNRIRIRFDIVVWNHLCNTTTQKTHRFWRGRNWET